MRIYYVDCGPVHFYGTAKQAKAAAQVAADANDCEVRAELCIIPDNREAMIALANGQTGQGEVVHIAKPKKSKR